MEDSKAAFLTPYGETEVSIQDLLLKARSHPLNEVKSKAIKTLRILSYPGSPKIL